ncbi:COG2129 Predicted phosphoesterases, related to the Icc protein [uncultured Caudovirales phage]|uniref:COG2129 Predicted phosphoesterases, related to the Icc protein n=1 Tax=uncultured Caudovirales phage TaxID=2100421 RepID=A0A6J5KPU1_9CAUD|nr:COG2129 Predicted phosphoesterases, related to the Icc protein [uncultured Caudovirales phage]
MKIHIMSDLHLEVSTMDPAYTPPECDVVVLAGDISNGKGVKGVEWAASTFSQPVVMVNGNHEFYSSTDMEGHRLKLLDAASNTPNVTVLDNSHVDIGGVRFIGSTLWTDFNLYGTRDKHMEMAPYRMNDYHKIRTGAPHYMKLTPMQVLAAHQKARAYLTAELFMAKDKNLKPVVVSHHAPHPNSIVAAFDGDFCNPYYASDLTDLINVWKPPLWIHGHMHSSLDYMVDHTRVVCNPRGYARYPQAVGENWDFNPAYVVKI